VAVETATATKTAAKLDEAESRPARLNNLFIVNVEMLGTRKHTDPPRDALTSGFVAPGGYDRGEMVTEKQLKAADPNVDIDRLIRIKALLPRIEVEGVGIVAVERKD
jgi:hypothetical protein